MKSQRVLNFIVAFSLVFSPLFFLPNQNVFDYYYIPKHFLLTLMCLLYIYTLWLSRDRLSEILSFDKYTMAILIYFSLLSLSVLFAINPKLAIEGNLIRHEGLATILMYILVFLAAKSSMIKYKEVFVYMLISATVIAIYGIIQFYGFDIFRREYYRTPFLPYSTIGNPNFLGTYLTMMIPFSAHFFVKYRKKFFVAVYIILLYCALATMSRGPWLGIIASISIYFYLYSRKYSEHLKSRIIEFMMISSTVLIVFSLFSDRSIFARFALIFLDLKNIALEPSISFTAGSNRWFIWEKVLIFISERPIFGYGISNLEIIFESRYHNEIIQVFKQTMVVDEAHNEFLDIAVSSGIPALISYCYFIFTCLSYRFMSTLERNDFYIPIFSAIIGYLVQSVFNISVVSVSYIFWILLGLLLSKSSANYN